MYFFEQEYKRELCELIRFSRLTYDRNMTSASGGNVSIRCGDKILITASGVPLRDVSDENVICCDMNGKIIEGSASLRPSMETKFHLEIYKSRPEINAVIHAHPTFCTVFSLENKVFPIYTESAKMFLGSVCMIPFAAPGTDELAENVRKAVSEESPNGVGYIMEAHGCLAIGKSLGEAFDIAETLEESAKIAVLKKIMN